MRCNLVCLAIVATIATPSSAGFFKRLLRSCDASVTTVSGSHAPQRFCSGDLIFEDDFQEFDLEKWQHENTLGGGGNWEFQWYSNNRTNSYTHDGILFIRPSLLSDQYGEDFLSSGDLNIEGGAPADQCTNPAWYGCERKGTSTNILNPVKSARVRTVESFNFRYGKVEVRAKVPSGDWLWPAIWLMPAYNAYGTWPSSGEMDLMESRGNRNLIQNGVQIGNQEVSSTLHYGPYPALNAWYRAHWERRDSSGYNSTFHRYQLDWTPDFIRFSVDDVELGKVAPPSGGFWEYGDFNNTAPNTENPWRYGSKMAPFDEKFYIIINLAVGGTNYFFPDDAINSPASKPWSNTSPQVNSVPMQKLEEKVNVFTWETTICVSKSTLCNPRIGKDTSYLPYRVHQLRKLLLRYVNYTCVDIIVTPQNTYRKTRIVSNIIHKLSDENYNTSITVCVFRYVDCCRVDVIDASDSVYRMSE